MVSSATALPKANSDPLMNIIYELENNKKIILDCENLDSKDVHIKIIIEKLKSLQEKIFQISKIVFYIN